MPNYNIINSLTFIIKMTREHIEMHKYKISVHLHFVIKK